jgi:hypothetical protein
MGVLTDFFIANEEEMNTVCHGWKKPAPLLDEYRTVTATNPFIQTQTTIRTRANPNQPEADEDAVLACEFRHLPWIAQKGILTTEVAELACVLKVWDEERAHEEVHGRVLIGPMDAEETVIQVHPTLLERLATLSSEECARCGAEWAKVRRANEPAGPDSDWITRVSEIAALAKRAVDDRRDMYMWICP